MTLIHSELIEAHLQEQLPAALEMLREMVGINSFTANAAGVNALGRLTADYFAPLGFTAEYIQADHPEYGEHLILTRHGTGKQIVGMVSHLDTVFTAEEEVAYDFSWREEAHPDGRRIYGPGTVDIKGGTVMMFLVLGAVQRFAPELFERMTWVLLLDAAEEMFVTNFRDICRERLPREETAACLVFEGGYMTAERAFKLVVARKGMARYKIHVEGRSAHAGSAHEQGANAVVQLAEITQRIAALTDYERQLTFNVGVFRGGVTVNRVPHEAMIEVEFRTFSPETFAEALISMQSLEGYSSVESAADGFACTTRVDKTNEIRPWPPNAGTDRLYEMWRAAAQGLGFAAVREERGGLSDGNFTWHQVPTLDGLGPAGGNAHCSERSGDGTKDQEYVLVDSFVPKALLNTLALLKLFE